MNYAKTSLGLTSLAAALFMTACAQAPETAVEPELADQTATKKVTLGPAISTVKPGASVTFSDKVAGPVLAGENASVTLTVNEGYPDGVLMLEASTIPGLEVFGAGTSARMDMSNGTTHTWRVDFEAANDGVYHLPIMATAAPEGGLVQSRAYAVRIEVGDWQAAQSKVQQAKPMATLEDGAPAIVMQAEETID
ncbi:MAG: hypothetical protein AAFO74_09840 [Pseudomonadota bacterium]